MLKADIKLEKAPILYLDSKENEIKIGNTEVLLKEGYEVIYKNGQITLKCEIALNGVETIEYAQKCSLASK